MLNFIKINPVGDELFHTDGRTDGQTDMKQTVALRNFVKAPNITFNFAFFILQHPLPKQ
jgi:hypothetical protein